MATDGSRAGLQADAVRGIPGDVVQPINFQHTIGWSSFPWLFNPDSTPVVSSFAAGFSDYFVDLVLANFGSVWMGLHFANPNLEGALTSEVSGGGYIRQSATFSTPANRTSWLANPILFTALPAVTLGYISLWDTQYNGNIMAAAPMTNATPVPVGGSYSVAAASLAVFID
jgi:hypothetical protein